MDLEIQELREQVARLAKTSEDTNRQVRKMRRSQRWHTIFQLVWWLTIVGVSGWAYITYVQPYVSQALAAYGNAKDFQIQVQDFFAQFGRTKTN
ncbi:hypothetical protein A3D70_01715 [Candidatus Adlerbacteria bacterium RIFCSPHIGHO2_02_FULL_54_18]|uniref:Uncharacterized protein n=2 Tax=Candidatus Adleribacteriota TaxID=1752736 RepID=A0A1F4Y4K7_9BACT|nr:MAG: hypothetical protein A2949_00690 [Candidatus Adlerbacteria bacterium RIFCSPLOWO2_01_FULL_54_21b]OGC88804.1 MAG: hypothetical protein A3D70_01715 [Candidatus Adlerbacteria bacterium RIFCSPHIGHO2_02_FULL_54_18]